MGGFGSGFVGIVGFGGGFGLALVASGDPLNAIQDMMHSQDKGGTPKRGNSSGNATMSISDLTTGMRNWLGRGVRKITNSSGDRIFMSQDGLRKIRFDIKNPSPHISPHAHFEVFVDGGWIPVDPASPQVYPRDVPQW